MEKVNYFNGELKKRQIPKNIFDASIISQSGKFVDVSSLIPNGEEIKNSLFWDQVKEKFDEIAEIMSSTEYAQFEIEINKLLEDVRGQHFIFDIEGVIVNDIQSLRNLSEKIYYVIPWMQPVLKKLIKNGNHVGFWTSASVEILEEIKKTMIPEQAELPSLNRDSFGKVVSAYQARMLNQMTDGEVVEVMKSAYPSANSETFQVGLDIFSKDMLDSFKDDPKSFLRSVKYPQLFITPKNGFFVDDNNRFIKSAIIYGWPIKRAIKSSYYPNKDDVFKIAQAIKDGVTQ